MFSTSTVGNFRYERTGQVVTVLRDTSLSEFRPVSGPKSMLEGAKSYRTDAGVELNADSTDESRFVTLDGDVLIRIK